MVMKSCLFLNSCEFNFFSLMHLPLASISNTVLERNINTGYASVTNFEWNASNNFPIKELLCVFNFFKFYFLDSTSFLIFLHC